MGGFAVGAAGGKGCCAPQGLLWLSLPCMLVSAASSVSAPYTGWMPATSPRCDGAIPSFGLPGDPTLPPPPVGCKWPGPGRSVSLDPGDGRVRRPWLHAPPPPRTQDASQYREIDDLRWRCCALLRWAGANERGGIEMGPTTGLTVRSGWPPVSLSLPPCVYFSPCLFLPLTRLQVTRHRLRLLRLLIGSSLLFPVPVRSPGSACTCTVRYLRDRAL